MPCHRILRTGPWSLTRSRLLTARHLMTSRPGPARWCAAGTARGSCSIPAPAPGSAPSSSASAWPHPLTSITGAGIPARPSCKAIPAGMNSSRTRCGPARRGATRGVCRPRRRRLAHAPDRPGLRRARRPARGNLVPALHVPARAQPHLTQAVRITDESLYSGRLIRDRAGRWVMLAFRNRGPDGSFIGELADPVPIRWGNRRQRAAAGCRRGHD